MHGGKNWDAITALVPGRTNSQCRNRWHNALNSSIALTAGREGRWTEDEDIKLKYAVQTHGGRNWVIIATLVPGRTNIQCAKRWHKVVDPSIDRANGYTGTWTENEDSKLKHAVLTHGGKNWVAIAALVPGRRSSQCHIRWNYFLDPSIDRAIARTGLWSEDEYSKLKDAAHTMHGGKNWVAIAALVPGRTRQQCMHRWIDLLDPSIDRATASKGKWVENEDSKLKDAVQKHGGRNWGASAALLPG
jgi:uncharacterized protein (DUF2237 family)